MTYSNIEQDTLDAFYKKRDEDLYTALAELNDNEIEPAADAAYAHVNALMETVRDVTGCFPKVTHVRAYLAACSDLSNPTVASAVENLLIAMAIVPP